MQLTLDRLANLALIVRCIGATALIARNWNPTQRVFVPPETYKTGEEVRWADMLPSGDDRFVVVFVRSTCSFCTNSMPFYARLNDLIEDAATVRLLFIGDEPKEVIETYLRQNGVDAKNIYRLNNPDPKLGVTPTLLVLRGRKVTHSWVGQLDRSKEGDVTKALQLE